MRCATRQEARGLSTIVLFANDTLSKAARNALSNTRPGAAATLETGRLNFN